MNKNDPLVRGSFDSNGKFNSSLHAQNMQQQYEARVRAITQEAVKRRDRAFLLAFTGAALVWVAIL